MLMRIWETSSFPPLQHSVNLPDRIDVEYTVSIASKWLRECQSHGKGCQAPSNSRLPTRILDFGSRGTSRDLKLLISESLTSPAIAGATLLIWPRLQQWICRNSPREYPGNSSHLLSKMQSLLQGRYESDIYGSTLFACILNDTEWNTTENWSN